MSTGIIMSYNVLAKRCPFCGHDRMRVWNTEDGYWHIQCDNPDCHATIYDYESSEEAINAWNKRLITGKEPGEER